MYHQFFIIPNFRTTASMLTTQEGVFALKFFFCLGMIFIMFGVWANYDFLHLDQLANYDFLENQLSCFIIQHKS